MPAAAEPFEGIAFLPSDMLYRNEAERQRVSHHANMRVKCEATEAALASLMDRTRALQLALGGMDERRQALLQQLSESERAAVAEEVTASLRRQQREEDKARRGEERMCLRRTWRSSWRNSWNRRAL